MVELRKRKTPPPAPVRPAKKASAPKGKKAAGGKTVVEQATEAVAEAAAAVTETVTEAVDTATKAVTDATTAAASTTGPPKAGDTIDLANFGGEVETHDGKKTTLAKLVEESKGGVVLFTYPKASTPGCTLMRRPTTYDHSLRAYRHYPSLPLPRLVRAPYCDRLQHLWSFQ